MASIFDSLAYETSNIPDSVRRAAQGELDYQKAIRNKKLPLAVEGSGIPESVRKAAQGAVERGASLNNITNAPYAEPAPQAGNPWMEGQRTVPSGLFGNVAKTVGKGLGGLGALAAGAEGVEMLNQKFGPAAYQNIATAVEEGQTRQAMQADPELANRGQSTVDRIVGGAMSGVNELRPEAAPAQAGLTSEELSAPNPNDVTVDQPPMQSPMEAAPPVVETPVGPVAQAAPTTVPQAAAKTMADQESQRQVLEQGAIKGLSTGAVSRPEFAEQIVKADAQKAGVTLTPEQIKSSTAVELTNMKSMSNDDVARYISYALMAAGVLATVFDKTGQAGENFSNSFNKQLDRNLQGGLAMQKARTEAAKQAQALQIANADRAVRQQQADTQSRSVDQTGLYQRDSVAQRREAAQGSLGAQYAGINAANSRSAASRDLQIRRLDQAAEQFEIEEAGRNADRTLRRDQYNTEADYKAALVKQGQDRNAIAARRAAAQGNEAKGIDITTKDAQGLVDAAVESQNLNVSKPAKAAIAQTVRVRAKNDPEGFARDPNGVILQVIKEKSGPYTTGPAGFFTDPTVNQRQLK